MNISRVILILVFMLVCISCALAEGAIFTSLGDCLVTNDIGIYTYKSDRANMGSGSGIVGLAGHFDKDHSDTVCTGRYSNINQIRGLPHEELRQKLVSVKVQVTQHAGSDSDKWLLHEVDIEFRNYYGIPGYYIKTINGNTVYVYGAGGRDYRWLSGNKVVMIEYHDSQLTKPEPLEVIQAYLTKHPSTLPAITMNELNSSENKTNWIKDEMDRRLWLGGKWMGQIKTVADLDKLNDVVKNLNVFLDYREKYYGIEARAEKGALYTARQSKDKAAIETKLNEYYKWWNENKDKPINL